MVIFLLMNLPKNLPSKITLVLSCLCWLVFLAGCTRSSSQAAPAYGVKVRYTQNQPLAFPDLTLEFVGQRKVDASPNFPRGFTYYDFKVSQGDRMQTISWSAGTGDIGPTLFEVGGQNYWLELSMSDKLGRLAEDELVLWQE